MRYQDLDYETQIQLAEAVMKGKPSTPENRNRAVEALNSNPDLVQNTMKTLGMEVEGMEDSGSIEDNLDPQAGQAPPDGEPMNEGDVGQLTPEEVELVLHHRKTKLQQPGRRASVVEDE